MVQMLRVFKHGPKQPQTLSNINLSIHKGEFVAIEGVAGAGKTTLLRLMGLWETPTQGQMVVDGMEIHDLPHIRNFARLRRLVYITPTDGFLPKLNLKDNLRLAVDIAQPSSPQKQKQCMETLAFVGLEGLWRQKPQQLLPSQRLRLVLARALIRMPRMLLVDACMDGMERTELKHWLSILRQYHRGGATVVVAGQAGFGGAHRRLRLEGGSLYAA
ncbi:MAG: ATP-binding cassette domain-containing protein [Cystobacterineae bacterium]|nr:ATP-binding cassette domain-containing protein [Cystobacterineae bacterium]